jgi:hypothetical protein
MPTMKIAVMTMARKK